MTKVLTYRGYKIEELEKMSLDDLVRIMPSSIRRSLKRGFTEQQKKLMVSIRKERKKLAKGEKPEPIETHCRDMPILPEMIGLIFKIYNGKEFVIVELTPEMIGHYLGEFSQTRKPVKHSAPGVGATRSSLFIPIR